MQRFLSQTVQLLTATIHPEAMPTKKTPKTGLLENKAGTTSQTVYSRIQVRRDKEAAWEAASGEVPLEGEICLTLDGENEGKFKIGDGKKTWLNLDYYAGGGSAQVFVQANDPLDDDPKLPVGSLWFEFPTADLSEEPELQVLVDDGGLEWKRCDPDQHVFMRTHDVQPEPSECKEGDLWYQTDYLDLYVRYDNAWVPAVGFNVNGYLPLTGGEMTGQLIIHNSNSVGRVFHFQAEDRSDGLSLEKNGQIKAWGKSAKPQAEDNLVTKQYVDELVSGNVGGIDDHFLIKDQDGEQEIIGYFHLAAPPDADRLDNATFRRTRVTKSELRSSSHTIGNPIPKYKDGTTPNKIDDRVHGKASQIVLRNCENSPETVSADWDPDVNEKTTNKVMIEEYDFDRIERIHYLKSNVRQGSNTGFDWENGEAKPRGHATNLPVDHTRWRQREETADVAGWYEDKEGAPQRFITWVLDPDDPDWDQRHRDKNKQGGYVSDSCLPDHRAANKAYVDRQISERGVGKGTDLCADGADDPNLEVGGFWRAQDYVDECSRIYIKIA